MQNQVGPGILTCEVASSVLTGGKRHTRTWLFCILCVLGLILCLASCSRSVETPARQISPAQTQSQPEPAPLSAPPENAPAISIPVVTRKLYIDSPDMEEIIEANLRLKAADYGFRVVPNRSDADVVLEGSAGIFKQEGLFGTCVPFYAFDVVRQGGPRRREEPVFKLQLGVPNNHPCIRFAVAQKILSDLRDGLNALDTKPAGTGRAAHIDTFQTKTDALVKQSDAGQIARSNVAQQLTNDNRTARAEGQVLIWTIPLPTGASPEDLAGEFKKEIIDSESDREKLKSFGFTQMRLETGGKTFEWPLDTTRH